MQDLTNIIYHYLDTYCQGRDQAIKLEELGSRISLEPIPWRLVAKAIELLRLEGKPVASCGKGVFIPATDAEKKACLRTIYRRALHTLASVRALEKSFSRQIVDEVGQEFQELSNGQLEMKVLVENV
jgi:hypothetical protein